MNDSEFHALVDEQLERIEEAVEESGADIDFEINGGVLTLEFTDRSKIIINRQEPLHQLWVATRFGGFHFDYREGKWFDDRSGDELMAFLSDAVSRQSGEQVQLD